VILTQSGPNALAWMIERLIAVSPMNGQFQISLIDQPFLPGPALDVTTVHVSAAAGTFNAVLTNMAETAWPALGLPQLALWPLTSSAFSFTLSEGPATFYGIRVDYLVGEARFPLIALPFDFAYHVPNGVTWDIVVDKVGLAFGLSGFAHVVGVGPD
jgi:hypothetical protein